MSDRKYKCNLVLVEWEDSVQPESNWSYLSNLRKYITQCVSVGWLLRDGKKVKILAPNFANLQDEDGAQVSGVIRIPTRCVTRITKLEEPSISHSS